MAESEASWVGVKQTGRQETLRWKWGAKGDADGGGHTASGPLASFRTRADDGGFRGVNQSHVDAL